MPRTLKLRAGHAAIIAIALLLCVGAPSANGAPPPREINITSDSPRGWIPSEDLEQQARTAALAYLAAMDQGRPADAWTFMSKDNQGLQSQAAFTGRITQFNAKAGPVVERRITMLTWTKDPPGGPPTGVYAAFDLVSRFANIDRYCGYVVLYQAPAGGPFRVMREEDTYLDNATAQAIAAGGKESVESVWARVAVNCPNYSPAG